MIQEFKLPDVGEGIAEAEIVRWLVKEGDLVKEDQELVEVETDKAVVTINSPYTGKVATLHGRQGQILNVGDTLASIEGSEPAPAGSRDSGTVVGSLLESEVTEVVRPVLATPAVRTLARQMNIDLTALKGSGPGGRITREDVEAAAGGPRQTGATLDSYGAVERIPLRGIRRTVAKRMAEASKRVADVTIWEDADITELAHARAEKNRTVGASDGVKLTYLPFLIKAVIAALRQHPYLNASLHEESEEIVLKKYYNIGIAVDTTEGLMVFVLKEADRKSIVELAREGAALAEKARLRKIDLSDLRGSTFTITNYGVVGASYGTPIINHPEVAILGVGRIDDRPVVRDGQIVVRKIMPLSLAFDHRVIDGVEAGRFLGVVIEHLQAPQRILE